MGLKRRPGPQDEPSAAIGWVAFRRFQLLLREPAAWGIACVLLAVLFYGVSKWPDVRAHPVEATLDSVHESGQLVALNLSSPGPDVRDWWGRIARLFAALAFAAFGFEVIRTVSWSLVERLRILCRRLPWLAHSRRIAIIGSTDRADWLAHGIATATEDGDGRRTLVTQVREHAPDERPALGPLLVATEPLIIPETLASLDVDRCDQVVVMADDDAMALGRLNAVLSLPDRRPAGCARRIVRVELRTPEVLEQVRSAGWDSRSAADGRGASVDVRVWNPDEIAARRALRSTQIDWRHSFARPGGRTELICIGFGGAGRLLASAFLRNAHHVDEHACRVTVVDENLGQAMARFRASHPRVGDIAHLEGQQLDAFDPSVRDMVLERLDDRSANVVVSVAVGDVDLNLAVALGLTRDLRHEAGGPAAMPVFVRQSGMLDVRSVFARFRSGPSALVPWGGLNDACRPGDVLESLIDLRAERLHAAYLACDPPRSGDANDPHSARRPWRELWSFFRDDNRNRADFLEARLRSVGLRIAGAGEGGTPVPLDEIDPQDRDALARLEHRRWVVSRVLAGWTRGDRDPVLRRHPSIRPWAELDHPERSKDDVARDVGDALCAGERLVRI